MWRKSVVALFVISIVVFLTDRTADAEQRLDIQAGKGVIAKRADENYFMMVSYRPEWLQRDLKLHYGTFFRKQDGRVVNLVGIDTYINAYVPQEGRPSPFIQVGFGLSMFDKKTENLGSQGELHLFFKIGAVKGNQHYSFAVEHFSNGGATENNIGENFITASWGILAF